MFELFPSRMVAINLFGFAVHWYGLLYFAAFVIAWFLVPRLQKLRNLSLQSDDWSTILSAAVVGVIVGGRLGYVLFYAPLYYLQNPVQIFAVWNGGMSSHGGFIGVAAVLLFVLRKRPLEQILKIADVAVIPVAIGLGLGRLGNFINQELYGTISNLPWAVNFSTAAGARHPIQIYDFVLMMVIAAGCYVSLKRFKNSGQVCALFIISYSVVRFLIEFIREQNGAIYFGLSEGQWLTIPLLIIGMVLWRWVGKRRQ